MKQFTAYMLGCYVQSCAKKLDALRAEVKAMPDDAPEALVKLELGLALADGIIELAEMIEPFADADGVIRPIRNVAENCK